MLNSLISVEKVTNYVDDMANDGTIVANFAEISGPDMKKRLHSSCNLLIFICGPRGA